MRGKYRPHNILEVVLLFIVLSGFSESNSKANENSKYLDAVREFADNVLKYGRDTYGPKHTPLFVDGLNIHTHEPVKWIEPDGTKWILSNFASQQTLLRTLDGLSEITGDAKYRKAAVEAIKYAFANLRSPNGLLHWGGHRAYDAAADRPCGRWIHELKAHYPYYQLMWQVDPQATKQFIEAFWSAHILDWSNLDMNRHGQMTQSLEKPWNYEYKGGPAFFEGKGLSFFNTGSDLIYAAAWLTKLSGDKEPLVWAKRLAHRYVDTRDPKFGISYGMYTLPGKEKVPDSYDGVLRKLVPGTTDFPITAFPWSSYTNPIACKCCCGYRMPTPGIKVHKHLLEWQSLLMAGEMLGSEGEELNRWGLEELTAFGRASYRKKDNVYVPILTDGTNLEGYVVKEFGPLGPKGVTLKPLPAGPSDFWAYTMGYQIKKDEFMWEMARNIARGNGFGNIGETGKDEPELNVQSPCSDPYALLAFLELRSETGKKGFLEMARRVGDNILTRRFHKGFFVASKKHIYTKFDAIDSLVLLHLHSALARETPTIPEAWPGAPFFEDRYRKKDIIIDNQLIYTLTESAEPPMSLQEAAAVGDIGLVRSIIEKGTEVDAREDSFYKTALHRAAISGHEDVAELLIAKGAQIDAQNGFPGGTPLDYASENGHKEIAELLIARGADVNATRGYPAGDTPLHSAARAGHKDIIELLITKGADINAKNNDGQTPKDIAAMHTKYLIGFISAAATLLVVGIVLAIPVVFSLRRVTGHPKRFFRYFALLIGICLVEYLAVVAGIGLSSGPASALVWELAFVCGLACAWGVVFGLWLRGRSTAPKVLKASVFVSLYTSLPIVCLGILSLVGALMLGMSIVSVEALAGSPLEGLPWPLNTILGFSIALVLGTVLLKTTIITGEVGLLIRLGIDSSGRILQTGN